MLAYMDKYNDPQPWSGQPVYGTYYPLDVENLWLDFQLADAGLYPVILFEPPPGRQIVGEARYILDGKERTPGTKVRQIFPTIDVEPAVGLYPQAEDDYEASRLVPPVPVGGIYCNGSQMMQRQR